MLTALLFVLQARGADLNVPDVDVTALRPSSVTPGATELSGRRLDERRANSLGATMKGEAGVTATDYGASASRPVVRGLGGDRVRITQNGVGVLDASGASDDHAVAVEPLMIDAIELVRGPAALLYGPQAVGGVVNLVTRRVPEKIPSSIAARAETRYSSTDDGRKGAVALDTPVGKTFAVHGDLSGRGADDYRVPVSRAVTNSQSRAAAGGLGASWIGTDGYLGFGYGDDQQTYGTVAEEFTIINLRQQRYDFNAAYRPDAFVREALLKTSRSEYAHDEVERGETGTRFRNDGLEARLDLIHRPVSRVSGRFGAQTQRSSFSARGDEGFLPETHTVSSGVFLYEGASLGRFHPELGGRLDWVTVSSDDDSAFGPGRTRPFTAGSTSLAVGYQVTPADEIKLTTSFTERAPNFQELFAHGPHGATNTYEIGDPNLDLERSLSVELGWRRDVARVSVFAIDVSDYITLAPTGQTDAGSGMPIYDFEATDARLFGGEGELTLPLPWRVPGGRFEFGLKLDLVHGEDRNTGQPLPRMTPVRETASLTYKGERWRADLEAERAEAQDRLAPFETLTPGYTLINLGGELPVAVAAVEGAVFARLINAFNQEARNAVSLLKDVAPMPGRSITVGLRATF